MSFQTVAEIVKELEKNEKVRLQLEFNKTGENVSELPAFSKRGWPGEIAEWALNVFAYSIIMGILRFPGCMLELAHTVF